MGAAGLVSSSTEMAARGGTGVDLEITRVPVRERGMTPYEILLSETQERMLVVAKNGHEDDVRAILGRWDLDAETIGRAASADGHASAARAAARRTAFRIGGAPIIPLLRT